MYLSFGDVHPRHPGATASPLSLEVRAKRASKDESATDGPSSFEARKGAHLRMTV